jgi:O-antigen/teichoic acid export membrane protein
LIKKMFSLLRETLSDVFRFARSPVKTIKTVYNVSIYRNSVYLMVNNVVVQATGFFFWMVAARLYTTEAVGLASAGVTSMTLLATVSTLGLDYSLIRFLPTAGDKSRQMINTCFTVSGLMSIVLALVFMAGLGIWSPALIPIRQHTLFFIIYVISVAVTTLNAFAQQTFIAKRRAGLALTRGLAFGLSRFIPLIIMAGFFQAFGIFTSWGIAVLIAVAISLTSISRIEPGYFPIPVIKKEILTRMVSFSFANYIAALVSMYGSVLSILVINRLGAEQNAYFYIGWALGYVLFMIPMSLSFSLFAEGSNDQSKLLQQIMRSLKLVMIILVPAIILMLVLGEKLLLLFGKAYSGNTISLLRILAVSALPLAINQIYYSMKRVKMQMKVVISLSLCVAIITLGLAWILLPRMGIEGAGVAFLTSQTIVAVGIITSVILKRKPKTPAV